MRPLSNLPANSFISLSTGNYYSSAATVSSYDTHVDVVPAVDERWSTRRAMLLHVLSDNLDKLQELITTAGHAVVRPRCVLQLTNRPNVLLCTINTNNGASCRVHTDTSVSMSVQVALYCTQCYVT